MYGFELADFGIAARQLRGQEPERSYQYPKFPDTTLPPLQSYLRKILIKKVSFRDCCSSTAEILCTDLQS